MGKFLLFFVAALIAIDKVSGDGVMLCEINPIPVSCTSRSPSAPLIRANYATVSGCTGSPVTWFQVWAGCSSTPGTGNHGNPYIQTPSNIVYATSYAGPYCYCRLKSINGVDLPDSDQWVYDLYATTGFNCADHCAYECGGRTMGQELMRNTVFAAAGYY